MEGQMSLFDGWLTEYCDTRPAIGTELEFLYKDGVYPCVVEKHCGADFFWVRLTGDRPKGPYDSGGWHLTIRGYGKDWRYKR